MTELAATREERLGLLKRTAEAGPRGEAGAGAGPGAGTDARTGTGTGTAADAGPEPGGS
ncbi:hypothetical protein [Streptomyces sp. NPDC088910]|uniref:hypothetical protein n=1 Tax=Streptomyces sp. NPDC088910 TaxID=3365911 RepID=UPI0037F39653